jgi:hypothetical protein
MRSVGKILKIAYSPTLYSTGVPHMGAIVNLFSFVKMYLGYNVLFMKTKSSIWYLNSSQWI